MLLEYIFFLLIFPTLDIQWQHKYIYTHFHMQFYNVICHHKATGSKQSGDLFCQDDEEIQVEGTLCGREACSFLTLYLHSLISFY